MSQSTNFPSARWGETASTYKTHVARITFSGAWALISMANKTLPINSNSRILDNGTGSGAIALQLAEGHTGAHITAADVNQGMLDTIKPPETSNITTRIANAHSLTSSFQRDEFTHIFCSFVIHVAPPAPKCLEEMYAVLQPSGLIAVATWGPRQDYLEIWIRAARAVDPEWTMPPLGQDPNPWKTEEQLHDGLIAAGFKDVQTRANLMPYPHESAEMFADFWLGKLGGNPIVEALLRTWKGDTGLLRKEMEKIVRDEYGNGAFVTAEAVLAVGRK